MSADDDATDASCAHVDDEHVNSSLMFADDVLVIVRLNAVRTKEYWHSVLTTTVVGWQGGMVGNVSFKSWSWQSQYLPWVNPDRTEADSRRSATVVESDTEAGERFLPESVRNF